MIFKRGRYRRVHTPTVIQMEAVECGAASLAMILAYYGKFIPLEEVRLECGVSRDGSNAFNIMRAAEHYDLDAKAFQLSDIELQDINYPAIIFWEYNHFVVLEGFSKDKAYLNDPALGPRYVSLDEFKESYTGVVLSFSKNENFKSQGRAKSLFELVYERLKSAPQALTYLFLVSMCLLIPGFAFPAFLTVFINTIFTNHAISWKWDFILAILLMVGFLGALKKAELYFLTQLNTKLSMRFFSDFYWHLLKLPIAFYSQRDAGEMTYRMNLNKIVAENLTGPVISALVNMMLIVFFAVAMFFYDTMIASITLGIGLVNLLIMYYIVRSRVVAYACLQQHIAKSVSQTIGGMQNIETIKSKGLESAFFSRWAGYFTKKLNATQQIETKDIYILVLPIFFQALAFAALLGIGSLRIIDGALSIGTLMALEILQINFLLPINQFVGISSILQDMKKNIERLNDVMKNEVDTIYNQRHRIANIDGKSKLQGEIEFRDVSFRYSAMSPLVLENISFTLKPGRRIAFIGPAGGGKSSIAKLAMGLFYPTSGQILYDGYALDEISVEIFRNSFASVHQDIFLFSGSIRDNLTFFNNKVSEKTLIEATKDACIHDEISMRQGAYDALLTEGGRNLSGGQRQRLEIARAFLYNPVLFVMDEATSALDNKTEAYVSNKIRERGCSALIMANRLSTIKDCDEIIVLDSGKIIQRGTHDSLVACEGIYQDLIKAEMYDE